MNTVFLGGKVKQKIRIQKPTVDMIFDAYCNPVTLSFVGVILDVNGPIGITAFGFTEELSDEELLLRVSHNIIEGIIHGSIIGVSIYGLSH